MYIPRLSPKLQGITTAIAMIEGLGSSLFAAALTFTVVVMYDAMGVRRHAGKRTSPSD